LGIVSLLFLAGCGGGTSQDHQIPPPNGAIPTITTILPNSAAAGGVAFTLTINGTNLVAASMVNFGGTAPTTTFVNSTQLTAAIPAAAIASTGTLAVTVTNPAPGGGTSNAMNFIMTSGNNPVPTVDSLSPGCVLEGEQAPNPFASGQLVVSGQNFVGSSVVRWNGSDRPTTFGGSSQLSAQISTSDIAAAGTAVVTVFNPAPGGGSSNSLTFTTVPFDPLSIVPTGKFAYAANRGCPPFGYVSMYAINPTNGVLASIGPPVFVRDFGVPSVTVDPFGKFVYAVSWGMHDTFGSISMYTINATTGALTFTRKITGCPGVCAPRSMAVDHSGKFAYVANRGGVAPNVSMFTINTATGAWTLNWTNAAAGHPVSVAVDPKGKFAYVTSLGDPPGCSGNVSMYIINAATGALTSKGTIATGTCPAVAVGPSGKFAYVTNSDSVSMYSIDAATGAWTLTGTVAQGLNPGSIAIDPSGKFAYVTNSGSNNVSMYSIDGATGAWTLIGTVAAGLNPDSIAIDPSGKFAYVTNSGSNDVSMYSIDAATGALSLIGTAS
jgi:6-phosphogluconolactonase (cycloisomerase 2 family)